jgi:hypothetical protein
MQGRVLTIPNVLSVIRLILVPVFLYLLLVRHAWGPSVAILMFGGVSDWADGKIARLVANQSSRLGELLDPLVDRIYMVTVPLGLALAGVVPWWLVAVLLGRDAVLAATLPVVPFRVHSGVPWPSGAVVGHSLDGLAADGVPAEEVASVWVPHAESVMTNGVAQASRARETRGEFTADTLQPVSAAQPPRPCRWARPRHRSSLPAMPVAPVSCSECRAQRMFWAWHGLRTTYPMRAVAWRSSPDPTPGWATTPPACWRAGERMW